MKIQFAALALAAASRSFAAEPPAVSLDRMLACAEITAATARLECFDRSVAATRAPDTRAAPAPAVVPAPAPVQVPSRVEASPPPPPQASSPAEEKTKGNEQPEATGTVHARITETRKASGGLYLIMLDNGQTWRHEQGSMEPYLKVGEAVTIRRATLGSYRLTLDAGKASNWVRVSRIR
jgi:hypothetical protein